MRKMENRSMDNLKKIQYVEQDLLDYVVKFCEKNNIEYWLDWGTLLGCIRHKGFIPWDDDIDIHMPREDYDKFIELEHNNPDSKYRILSPKYNKDYYYSFAKMVDNDTTLEEIGLRKIKDLGVYVDIFPLDYVNKRKSLKVRIERFLFMIRMAPAFMDYNNRVNNKNRVFFIKILKVLNKIFRFDKTGYLADRLAARNKKGEYWGLLVEGESKDIYDVSDFNESINLVFEGENFSAPVNYNRILRNYYGDYMQLPPVEKQQPHHSFDAYYK